MARERLSRIEARKELGDMRENITLECVQCGNKNYRTSREIKKTKKLEIKKFCKFCHSHQMHKEKKK